MNKSYRLLSVRSFSQIQKTTNYALANVERSKRFHEVDPVPKTFAQVEPVGKDLYVPKNIAEMAALDGMPRSQQKRTVLISQVMWATLQSGQRGSNQWQITWKQQERWSNPLMGWTSTADPMSNVRLRFATQEAAIRFAERNGWSFEILRGSDKSTVKEGTFSYQDNFLDHRTSIQLAKEGMKNKIWENPKYGESHWFMPLKYHGDGVVSQHGPKSSSN